jgi:hypothetical protein
MDAHIDIDTLPASMLLNSKQTSVILNIPEATLNIWRVRGGVSLSYVKVGKAVRYRVSAIREFLNANTVGAEAA